MNNRRSCIDLIFTNNPCLVTEAGVRTKISDSCDHCPIFANLQYRIHQPKAYKRWVWDFKRGNYDNFRHCLMNAQWNQCFVDRDVNSTVINWMSLFKKCAEAHVPHYEATIRPRDKNFMDSALRRLMKKRDRLHRQYRQTGDQDIGDKYRRCRNDVLSHIRQSKRILEKK